MLPWGDGRSRWSQIYFAGLLGDQQEADKFTAENCACHHCKGPKNAHLMTDGFDCKSMIATKKRVEKADEGEDLALTCQKWIA